MVVLPSLVDTALHHSRLDEDTHDRVVDAVFVAYDALDPHFKEGMSSVVRVDDQRPSSRVHRLQVTPVSSSPSCWHPLPQPSRRQDSMTRSDSD